MTIVKIDCEPRQESGSKASRKLRASGYIPVVLYSHGQPAMPFQLDGRKWSNLFTESLHLVRLELPGGGFQMAAVREIQRDPMTQDVIHADFQGVSMDEATEFRINVEFIGTPIGVKDGGVLTISSDHIMVECLPTKVPDKVSIDIDALAIGHSLNAGQVALPEDVKLVSDPASVLVSITTVRVVVEEVKPEVAEVPVEGAEEAKPGEEKEEKEEKEKKEKKEKRDKK